MKKLTILLAILLGLFFTGCEKDEVEPINPFIVDLECGFSPLVYRYIDVETVDLMTGDKHQYKVYTDPSFFRYKTTISFGEREENIHYLIKVVIYDINCLRTFHGSTDLPYQNYWKIKLTDH